MGIIEQMKETAAKFENCKIMVYQAQQKLNNLFQQMHVLQGEYQALQRIAQDQGLIGTQINDFNRNFIDAKPTAAGE